MSEPKRWELWEVIMEDTNSEWVRFEDYAALKRRHQDVLDAIERTGGLDNIRRVEVSQPVVIDMARENAFLKGENARLKAEVERLIEERCFLNEKLNHFVKQTVQNREQVERLRKAGDELLHEWSSGDETDGRNFMKGLVLWNAAKEGKQS